MQAQIDISEGEYHQDEEDARHDHQDVRLARLGDVERQVVWLHGVKLISQWTISRVLAPTVLASRPSGLIWIKGKGAAPALASRPSRRLVNAEGPAMPVNIDALLPTAKEIQRQAALADAEKAE